MIVVFSKSKKLLGNKTWWMTFFEIDLHRFLLLSMPGGMHSFLIVWFDALSQGLLSALGKPYFRCFLQSVFSRPDVIEVRVLKCLGCSDSFFRIYVQQSPQEVDSPIGQFAPIFVENIRFRFLWKAEVIKLWILFKGFEQHKWHFAKTR